jgi:hypothetical protein
LVREQEAGQCHRPDDGALVGAFGPAGREQAHQADAGDRGGGAGPLMQQGDRGGDRGGSPPVILGQRQEHVSERYIAAERDTHAGQPPDHWAAGLTQVPDQP